MNSDNSVVALLIFFICLALASFGAWGTHVISCLMDERWGFLIAGAIAVPIAVLHGVGIWFGIW